MKILKILLMLLFLPTAFGQDHMHVTIGFQPPVSSLCRALLSEAFSRLGLAVDVIEVPAERAIQLANDGLADAECMRIKGIERIYPNIVQVPTAIYTVQFVAFTKGNKQLPNGWQSLKPYRTGAVYGWKLIEMRVKEIQPASFIQVHTAKALFTMLDLDRIDVAALNRQDGLLKLRELGLTGILPVEPPLAEVPLYFSLNAKHTDLVPELDRTFNEMQSDGTWEQITLATFREFQ